MSAPDPHCPTCLGRGTYPCGGAEIVCPCTHRDCPVCPPDDVCDEHFAPTPVLPGSVESLAWWDRECMAAFERLQALVLDRETGGAW